MIYFIYEPDGWGKTITQFDNEKDWLNAVENFDFMADYCDDGWSESVENIIAGKAPKLWDDIVDESHTDECDYYEKYKTHQTIRVNEKSRPDDVDDEGFATDEDGITTYWGEWDYVCGYAFDLIK